MKKSAEILSKLDDKKKAMQKLMEEGKVKEAHVMIEEVDDLQEEYEAQKKLEDLEDADMNRRLQNGQLQNVQQPAANPKKEVKYKDVFLKAFRGKALTQEEVNLLDAKSALSTSTNEDGGYLIPEDMQTKINELKRDLPALENLVTVEPVNTDSGSRNIEKDALYTPFGDITEGNPIADTDSPQFVNITFTIQDKGGILPVPNNLLNDTDTALENYLVKWLAKKSVATRNELIKVELGNITPTVVADVDDIKEILNVTLPTAIARGAKFLTNQSGFNYLDTLKDNDGNYLLQPDPTDKTKKMILNKEVVVVDDKVWGNRDDGANFQAPLVVGDLKEAVVLFDRQQMSLLSTKIGGDAFKYNRTDIRAIEREDVEMFDSDAVVFGEIEVGASV